MDRFPLRRFHHAAAALVIAVLVGQLGCANALFTALYLAKGTNTSAEFAELKGKRVAVVCRPMIELQYNTSSASEEIARQLGRLLRANVKKIEMVDAQRVAEWTDEHAWEEYSEIGKALEADIVVGVDLEQFSLYQGQTLYQGKARARVTAHDVATGELLFERMMPQSVYPPNAGIPTTERLEDEFRREFIAVFADQVGRYFYDHDTRLDFAQDATTLR